jgi:hypothetical protein
MLRVWIYLKSSAVAEFEAEAIMETAEAHPRFKLECPAAENGGRRLVYLDRDDVSAVVVEDTPDSRREAAATEAAMLSIPGLAEAVEAGEEMITMAGESGVAGTTGRRPIDP